MSSAGVKYAFVVPRFGRGVAGGAETLVGELARRLAARGDVIDVLTTCAKDNRTWNNELPEGQSDEDDVCVRRFPVRERNLDLWIPLQIRLSEGLSLTLDEEMTWMEHSVNSDGLYAFLATHAPEYAAVFYAPYLFGTTFWGSLIHPENSILIPCLHDESYAYTKVVQTMFRTVKGCLFNALPEAKLCWDLYGDIAGGEVGMGFDLPQSGEEGIYFKEDFPYLLYLGRKETGKNAHLLVDYFIKAKDASTISGAMKLVIAGGGSFSDLHRPDALERSDIIDLGHVSESDKQKLLRGALSLVQPSTNESFSIVIMESWLLEVPVLVHARCAVTRDHVEASSGGLYFGDLEDFTGVVNRLHSDSTLRDAMGRAGKEYVTKKYSWNAVLDRFDSVVKATLADSRSSNGSQGAN